MRSTLSHVDWTSADGKGLNADTSDRIFSTSVDCAYQFILPVIPSLTIPSLTTLNIDFDLIFEAARTTTLKVFATHNSASVQATLYIMAQDIIRENADVAQVTYSLPNKVRHFLSTW